jgi:thiol-disulfide isomerase/thioredoxin
MKSVVYPLILLIACTAEKDQAKLTYTPFSQSVVHLNLNDDLIDSTSVSATVQTNIPKGGNDSNVVTAKKEGDYYLNIETDRPAKSFLYVGNQQYNIVLIPKDTTHLTVRILQEGIHLDFHGKTKVINEYYLEKKQSLGYSDVRVPLNESLSTTNYNLLKQHTDSVINRELTFFKKYASAVQLPEWFVDYEESEIVYMGAGYKTAIPHANQMFKYFEDSLPNDYYDFLNHIELNNHKAVLSSNYFSFLDEYFLRSLPVSETIQLFGFSRANKMMGHQLGQSKVQLSGDIKDIYHKSNFSSMINYYSDSLAIDSLAHAFQVSDYKELVRIAGIKSRNEMQKLNLNRGDTIPDFILTNNVDSLISIRTYQDQILYLNFWATWCGPCIQNMPELNKLIAQYEKRDDIKFINICLDSERDKWLAGISKHKLNGVNLFAQGNWNSKLRAYFNITGIPHYVIIGKGNILFENATDKAPKIEQKIKVMLTNK